MLEGENWKTDATKGFSDGVKLNMMLQIVFESPCVSDVAWSLCLDPLHSPFQSDVILRMRT